MAKCHESHLKILSDSVFWGFSLQPWRPEFQEQTSRKQDKEPSKMWELTTLKLCPQVSQNSCSWAAHSINSVSRSVSPLKWKLRDPLAVLVRTVREAKSCITCGNATPTRMAAPMQGCYLAPQLPPRVWVQAKNKCVHVLLWDKAYQGRARCKRIKHLSHCKVVNSCSLAFMYLLS